MTLAFRWQFINVPGGYGTQYNTEGVPKVKDAYPHILIQSQSKQYLHFNIKNSFLPVKSFTFYGLDKWSCGVHWKTGQINGSNKSIQIHQCLNKWFVWTKSPNIHIPKRLCNVRISVSYFGLFNVHTNPLGHTGAMAFWPWMTLAWRWPFVNVSKDL